MIGLRGLILLDFRVIFKKVSIVLQKILTNDVICRII